jgi:hypothetical protein
MAIRKVVNKSMKKDSLLNVCFVLLPLISFNVVSNELPEKDWLIRKRKK